MLVSLNISNMQILYIALKNVNGADFLPLGSTPHLPPPSPGWWVGGLHLRGSSGWRWVVQGGAVALDARAWHGLPGAL